MVSSDQLEAAVPCEPMHVNTAHSDGATDELDLSPAMQTVAAAVASEKAKQRQQSLMLDKWLSQNGANLYPSRDEKERLAAHMNMTYMQVNRWFANRRRKQTKRSKAVNSPKEQSRSPQPQEEQSVRSVLLQQGHKTLDSPVASVLSAAIAAALAAQQPHQRQPVSGCAENEEKEQSPRSSEEQEDGKEKMVAVQLAEQLSAAEQLSEQLRAQQAALLQHVHHREHHLYSQVVPQQPLSPHHQPLSPLLQSPEVAKLVAQAQAGILPPQYNPLLLQILLQQQQQQLAAAAAAAQSQHGQQLLALQQHMHMQQHMASMHAAPQPPTAHTQAQLCAPSAPSWMSPPVSASPVPAVSDESELSELSELSPRPSSPPFKDPEQLADQSLLRLLNASQLSEKEHIAVSVLAGFASMAR